METRKRLWRGPLAGLLLPALAAGALIGCGGSSGGGTDTTDIAVPMSAGQQTNRTLSAGSGSGTLTVGDDRSVSGSFTLSDLTAAISKAHIHRGFAGESGSVAVTLDVSGSTVSVPAGTMLSQADFDLLQRGGLYVNVHTSGKFDADGEVRGQIIPAGINVVEVELSPEEAWIAETHDSIDSDGDADGVLTIDADGNVEARLRIRDITPATSASTGGAVPTSGVHLHHSGGILTLDQVGTSEIWAGSGPVARADFDAGALYFNVHTDGSRGGELRGQIGSPTTEVVTVELSKEAAFVYGDASDLSSSGDAYGLVTVNRSTNTAAANLRMTGITPATSASTGGAVPTSGVHLHHATGIVTLDQVGTSEVWSGSDTIDPADVDSLGGLYLNIHTDSNRAGEMRGPVFSRNIELAGGLLTTEESFLDGSNDDNTSNATAALAGLFVDKSKSSDNAAAVLRVVGMTPGAVAGTGVHVHAQSSNTAPTGTIVITLSSVDAAKGTYASSSPATVDVDAFLASRLYFNVHGTAGGPTAGGELRAQIVPDHTGYAVVVPNVDEAIAAGTAPAGTVSTGEAVANLIMNERTGAARARMRIENLEPGTNVTTGVHLHHTGGIVDLVRDGTTNFWSFDTVFDEDLVDEVDSEQTYFNVHGADGGPTAGGELRGQIELD